LFGIGGFELFIILLFAFIIFGPDKLPEVARTVGAALAKFRKAQEEMNEVIHSEVLIDPEKDNAPKKDASVVARAETAVENKPAPKHTAESFAERKARHDKERAELQRAEEVAANRAAMRQKAAQATEAELANNAEAAPAAESAVHDAAAATDKPTMSAAELYGTVPVKPAPKHSPSAYVAGDESATPSAEEGVN